MSRSMRPLALTLAALAGCTSSSGRDASPQPRGDAAPTDTGVASDTGGQADTGLRVDTGMADPDAGPRPDGGGGAFGFSLRVPQVRTVPCAGGFCPSPTSQLEDIDHVCAIRQGGFDGYLYVQATPTEDRGFGGRTYTTSGAWVSVGGVVTAVTATYDPGGNHRNDFVDFTYGGQGYRTYHSSFGVGWRVCQPMDCLQLVTNQQVTDDGCTPERRMPIVCEPVDATGAFAPLVDDFAYCNGDPNAPDAGH